MKNRRPNRVAWILCLQAAGLIFWAGEADAQRRKPNPDQIQAAVAPLAEFKTLIADLRAADPATNAERTRNWILPGADAWFKQNWGEAVGGRLAAMYGGWAKAVLATGRLPGGAAHVWCYHFGYNRFPKTRAERELVKAAGSNPLCCFYTSGNEQGGRMGTDTTYFMKVDGTWRCLGPGTVLDFEWAWAGGETMPDPVAAQAPTLESFTAMMVAFKHACAAGDADAIKRITTPWRIPDEKAFFESKFGAWHATNALPGYAVFAGRYTGFTASEMSAAYGSCGVPKIWTVNPGKPSGDRYVDDFLRIGGWKAPVFCVSLENINSEQGFDAWGPMYFMFIEGAFRAIGMSAYIQM